MPTTAQQEHVITFTSTGSRFKVTETSAECEMRNRCPVFFRTPHGKRETFTVYRGQLIVRNTVDFGGGKPQRRTVVYLYLVESLDDSEHGMPDLFCVGHPDGVRQAKRLIDQILESGEYSFD